MKLENIKTFGKGIILRQEKYNKIYVKIYYSSWNYLGIPTESKEWYLHPKSRLNEIKQLEIKVSNSSKHKGKLYIETLGGIRFYLNEKTQKYIEERIKE